MINRNLSAPSSPAPSAWCSPSRDRWYRTRASGRRRARHLLDRQRPGLRQPRMLRSSFAGSRASQRCPHVPRALTRLASSCPASVSSYSGPWGPSVRMIAPTKTRAWSRSERTVRDTRGMPRRMSLKRRLPHRISRTIKRVHRPPSTSWARAMEQNCPYPVMSTM